MRWLDTVSGPDFANGAYTIGISTNSWPGTILCAITPTNMHVKPWMLKVVDTGVWSKDKARGQFVLGRWYVGCPIWFAALLAAAAAAAPFLQWRFSLRTLLIVTTLAAVVLGFVVWLRQ